MATRRPVNHPFAYTKVQGQIVPALILSWTHGISSAPDDWFADIVVNSINEPGHPVEMFVAASELRPANLVADGLEQHGSSEG